MNIYVQMLDVLPGRLITPEGQPDRAGVTLQITPHVAPGAPAMPVINVNIPCENIAQLAQSLQSVAEEAQRQVAEGGR